MSPRHVVARGTVAQAPTARGSLPGRRVGAVPPQDDPTAQETRALRRLHELDVELDGGRSMADALDELVHVAAEATGFQHAELALLTSDRRVETVAVATTSGRPHLLVVHDDVLDRLESGESWGRLRFVPRQGARLSAVPPLSRPSPSSGEGPLEDVLYAPVVSRQSGMVGVLAAAGPLGGDPPEAWRCRLLELFAESAARIVEAGRARELLLEEVRLSTVCRRILHAATQQLDLPAVVAACCEPLADGLRVDAVWLRTFDRDADGPRPGLGACHPPTMGSLETDERFAITAALAERCWRAQEAVVVAVEEATAPGDALAGQVLGAGERDEVRRLLRRIGYASMLIAPLGLGAEAVGYIVGLRADPRDHWGERERSAALEIGRELGPAVLHARMFSAEREQVGQLQALDRHKGELMVTIAHELKNPLTSILGHLEVLDEEDASPSLAAIGRNADRIRGLADDLMVLAKVEDSSRPFTPVPVDLAEAVRGAMDLVAIQAAQSGVHLRVVGGELPLWVRGEPGDLARVVDNLVGNAVKYTPENGHVVVELARERDRAVLAVHDDGLGIDPSEQATIFETFARSSNPQARSRPGTGLGLAIVRRIVLRHEGTIEVDSALGRGSTFRVDLPVAPLG